LTFNETDTFFSLVSVIVPLSSRFPLPLYMMSSTQTQVKKGIIKRVKMS